MAYKFLKHCEKTRNIGWHTKIDMIPSEKCKLIQNVVLVAFPFAECFNSQNIERIQNEIQRHENSFHYYATKIRLFKASYESSRPNSVVKKCSTSLKYVPQSCVSNESCYKKIAATIWLELKGKLKAETQEIFLAHYCIAEICYLKLFA